MKRLKLIGIVSLSVVLAGFSGPVVYAVYHHVDDCFVCHYAGQEYSGCITSPNLVLIRNLIDTPCGDLAETVFGPFVVNVPPYNGVCQVCHETSGDCSTNYYRNDGSGVHPEYKPGSMGPTDCHVCHLHAPYEFGHEGSIGTGCDACHGQEGGAGTAKSHGTHTKMGEGKGPGVGCGDCHDTNNFPNFADGEASLAATTSCDNCHSPGGAFDGTNMAKANWEDGIYGEGGTALQSDKEQWCAGCHDDDPAYSAGEEIEIIVDNIEADFVGAWSTSTGDTQKYGDDLRFHEAGTGSDTATWTPNIPRAGTYNVYAWWSADSNRATNAKYTVYYDAGSDVVEVNQKTQGGQWNSLGAYSFTAGTSGSVVLSDDADGLVIADAVRFYNGTYAPNVIGDNTTYGFYLTGHKMNCLSCHDAGKSHIDGEHRTFNIENDGDYDNQTSNSYDDSYRLKDGSINLPRPWRPNDTADLADYALCFDCHNPEEVLGVDQDEDDVSHTNFWGIYSTPFGNAHTVHAWKSNTLRADADWDMLPDSRMHCMSCHNVHGSSTPAMIRDGRLISSYGTTDKIPALNFTYLGFPAGDPATATFSASLPDGDYEVWAWWEEYTNRARDATYTIYSDGADPVEVTVDQYGEEPDGGTWHRLGTGIYTYNASTGTGVGTVVLDNDFTTGLVVIADAVQWRQVSGGSAIETVDTNDAAFVDDQSDWVYRTNKAPAYNNNDAWIFSHSAPGTNTAEGTTLATSGGGWMRHGAKNMVDSKVCITCHNDYEARYVRVANPFPKVIPMPGAVPNTVSNDGTGSSTITVSIYDPDNNTVGAGSVTIDLSPLGLGEETMTDNLDGTFAYVINVPYANSDGTFQLKVTATDADDPPNTGSHLVQLTVVGDVQTIYLDDPEAVLVPECVPPCDYNVEWEPYSGSPQEFGTGFQYKKSGDGSGTATWALDVPATDTYDVFAWWVDNTCQYRSQNVPYVINYDGGSDTVYVDQTDTGPGGGEWHLLGSYPFAAGPLGSVVIRDDATPAPISGGVTIVAADAIKLVPAP